jgi:hypothetical protein
MQPTWRTEGLKKKLLVVAIVIVGVALVVGLLVVANLGRIVKVGVEKGGTAVLGVPTELEKASVSLLGGTVGFDGLKLGSPEGFDAPEMFKLSHMHVSADIGSMTSDEIVVREVVVDGAEITLEFSGGKTNWGTLLSQLESEPVDEEEAESEKKIRIDRIAFSNCKLRVQGIPIAGSAAIPLPSVEITDLRSADGSGMTVGNVLADVISSLYRSILGAVKGVVAVEELEKLGKEAQEVVGDAGAVLKDAGTDIGETAGDAAKKATGALKDAGTGIGETAGGAAKKATGVLKGVLGRDEEDDE